jgi:murein DD-endopeptidase MepM/ murein hydrolase activator NlpD
MLDAVGSRYLVSQYAENRRSMLKGSKIESQGRVYHLGIDIFANDQEEVYAPSDGQIVVSAREKGPHSFGNYLIFAPDNFDKFIFLGHLAKGAAKPGPVKSGQKIARLGSYKNNENGGWSCHLHLQILKDLPQHNNIPIGYSSLDELEVNKLQYPDPLKFFPDWKIKSL